MLNEDLSVRIQHDLAQEEAVVEEADVDMDLDA